MINCLANTDAKFDRIFYFYINLTLSGLLNATMKTIILINQIWLNLHFNWHSKVLITCTWWQDFKSAVLLCRNDIEAVFVGMNMGLGTNTTSLFVYRVASGFLSSGFPVQRLVLRKVIPQLDVIVIFWERSQRHSFRSVMVSFYIISFVF